MISKHKWLTIAGIAFVLATIFLLVLAGTTTSAVSPTPTGASQAQAGKVQIIVKFTPGANSAAKDGAIHGVGGVSLRDLPQIRTRVMSVPANAVDQVLAALAKNSNIERAATTITVGVAGTPDDPGYAEQWALPKIAWDQVYGTVTINGSATIAVLDTGVDASHPDLAAQMVAGQSFVGGDANSDPNGHGTGLAGIAAASVNNATGVAGVAYAGATISPLSRFFSRMALAWIVT